MNTQQTLTPQSISIDVLLEKYAKDGETSIDQVRRRVAKALASVELECVQKDWEERFYKAMVDGFIPAGRINSAAGMDLRATLINCFTQPVGDSISEEVDGVPSIYTALAHSAETMRRGGGVGYNFSKIRPVDAIVKGTMSRASGPISYMKVFDRSCNTVESAGARRGAQMGALDIEHPDIEQFIVAKRDGGFNNFNLSVFVTDAFMRAVENDEEFYLHHIAEPSDAIKEQNNHKKIIDRKGNQAWVYKTVKAKELWELIMKSTYDFAEPGILFRDTINRDNNLSYIEEIDVTNPCAEQPLPPYGCCCLGSINLAKFVKNPYTDDAGFDFSSFEKVVAVSIRMLDNVLDVTPWPLEQQKQEAQNKRRIGLGFTGLGSMLYMMMVPYDSDRGRAIARAISVCMTTAAYKASIALAIEKGPFPLFDKEKHCKSDERFIAKVFKNTSLMKNIKKYGIRNSHLTSIAPTGTISLAFGDNVSNGLEPAFCHSYMRKKRNANGGHDEYEVIDHGVRVFKNMFPDVKEYPDYMQTAMSISVSGHLDMLAAIAPWIDTAMSKTVNIPADYPFEDFKNVYMNAWKNNIKGVSTYRPNNVLGSVLSVKEDKPKQEVGIQLPTNESIDINKYKHRPSFDNGNYSETYAIENGTGKKTYLVVGFNEKKIPFEILVSGYTDEGVGAVAKSLSLDIRTQDFPFIKSKLAAMVHRSRVATNNYKYKLNGEHRTTDTLYDAIEDVLMTTYNKLRDENSEIFKDFDRVFSENTFKISQMELSSWTYQVGYVHNKNDSFDIHVSEALVNNKMRPVKVAFSGDYPSSLSVFAKHLNIDLSVSDVNWVLMKLAKYCDYMETNGDALRVMPGGQKRINYVSLISYIAHVILHRFKQLDAVTEEHEAHQKEKEYNSAKVCEECGVGRMVKRDGCTQCTHCNAIGSCG